MKSSGEERLYGTSGNSGVMYAVRRMMLCCLVFMLGCDCGSPAAHDHDGTDGQGEGAGQDWAETDRGEEAGDAEPPEAEAAPDDGDDGPVLPLPCGNGILDPGEECDDGNRLNGDGCDWLCVLGDGTADALPPVDPAAGSLGEAESAIPLDPGVDRSSPVDNRLPLTWNGDSFATVLAHPAGDPTTPETNWLQGTFFRFDLAGRTLDASWNYYLRSPRSVLSCTISSARDSCAHVELTWMGSGFGMMWVGTSAPATVPDAVEVLFQRLNPDGKPNGDVVVVAPAASWASFALAWTDPGFACTFAEASGDSYRQIFRRLDSVGAADPGSDRTLAPEAIPAFAQRVPADLAWSGSAWVGSWVTVRGDPEAGDYVAAYTVVSADGSSLARPIFLGPVRPAAPPAVVWTGERFVLVWMGRAAESASADQHLYLAQLSGAGEMLAAPLDVGVCSAEPPWVPCNRVFDAAWGHASLAVAWADAGVNVVRYDRNGVFVDHGIFPAAGSDPCDEGSCSYSGIGLAAGPAGFAAIAGREDPAASPSTSATLPVFVNIPVGP